MAKFKSTKSKKYIAKSRVKKLPSNSRSIPERLNSDEIVFLVGTIAVLLAMFVVSMDLYTTFNKQHGLVQEKNKVIREIAFWENEVKVRPDYRDAYFSLALLSFRLKDVDASRKYLNKALEIDPNFEKGRELEKILDSY